MEGKSMEFDFLKRAAAAQAAFSPSHKLISQINQIFSSPLAQTNYSNYKFQG